VLDELERGGTKGFDISDDEIAKSHARYDRVYVCPTCRMSASFVLVFRLLADFSHVSPFSFLNSRTSCPLCTLRATIPDRRL
jgi:rubredoxin